MIEPSRKTSRAPRQNVIQGMAKLLIVFVVSLSLYGSAVSLAQEGVRLATFDVDASPRVGSPLAYDPCDGIEGRLRCTGVVLLVEPEPIVLCAVDWIGVANESHDEFRQALADAAQTRVERVAVHALHQHDAPRMDTTADAILAEQGINHQAFDVPWFREFLKQCQVEVKAALAQPELVTHVSWAESAVEKVASNRRILGQDGKVKVTRYTATRDPAVRAYPAGTIDPMLKLVAFWSEERPLAILTYYATHPQSYYRTGLANPDFPGMARDQRQRETGVIHIHFNGAGGNIGAGKWNDGAKENRQVLADRVASGMAKAWDTVKRDLQESRRAVSSGDIQWRAGDVALPPAPHLDDEKLQAIINDGNATPVARLSAASDLAWLRRAKSGHRSQVACLEIHELRILHLPGELFVEYQLAAQQMAESCFVAMAAYGDYGPGYIGTEIAYDQGGYETSQRASRVAPSVEKPLLDAIQKVLQGKTAAID